MIRRPTYINEWATTKCYLLNMHPIFDGSVHNFGKSDDDVIN